MKPTLKVPTPLGGKLRLVFEIVVDNLSDETKIELKEEGELVSVAVLCSPLCCGLEASKDS